MSDYDEIRMRRYGVEKGGVPQVFDSLNPPPAEHEYNDGQSIVETQGYIPAQVQIESMIAAGMRLDTARKEAYDFGSAEEVDPDFEDPTRTVGFDMADASILGSLAKKRLDTAAAEMKKVREAAAKKEAEDFEAFKASKKQGETDGAE